LKGFTKVAAASAGDRMVDPSFAAFLAAPSNTDQIFSSCKERKVAARVPRKQRYNRAKGLSESMGYDALLVVSFGGPESNEEVLPFLENVLRGKNVPRERMLAVAEHYYHFGGKSPINQQNRELIEALRAELDRSGPKLPIYLGNRNWRPMLAEALAEMRRDGIGRALAFVTSAFSSYSGCRQYRENIANAQQQVGEGAPEVDKLRVYYNHPGFVEPMAERVGAALAQLPAEAQSRARVLYTAHSIPLSMAQGCNYEKQLLEASRLVSEKLAREGDRLVFQSRSGPATQPWLEPDVLDALRKIKASDEASGVVVAPIGFISDHMEVLYDLDTEARHLCEGLQLPMVRAKTVGTHRRFVTMIRELIEERMSDAPVRLAMGRFGPNHDVCPVDCCLPPVRP
jgi:protoporphyrin/coproporphyrin ferrochelatase